MRKVFLFAMIAMCSLSFGQLQTKTPEEKYDYRTVYERGVSFSPIGCIRYFDNKYVLFGGTDNQFEKRYASIFLGNTKESAIQTIIDIQKLKLKLGETIIVNSGYDDRETKIFGNMFNSLSFSTDDVAGTCFNLRDIASKKAIESIKKFEE